MTIRIITFANTARQGSFISFLNFTTRNHLKLSSHLNEESPVNLDLTDDDKNSPKMKELNSEQDCSIKQRGLFA